MRVSDLSGDLLDYWVARAEGIEHGPDLRAMRPGSVLVRVWSKEGFTFYTAYTPSTDIAQAWPIIEREQISICYSGIEWNEAVGKLVKIAPCQCVAMCKAVMGVSTVVLEACMRAYVASKFGETVPEEMVV
ncbi:phage protein NinX family protein [Paraburkholderia sp. BL6665CI2N2]|uniref:phage protein NinX family protein n=1 Tax=Paraburkholderia sp. BL6665CI2N2 TaxID=1938806 RepID=UPI00141700D8|nr:phage protein NinX family protein [Paraburkholderia sp. BL6665CI2N2]